MAMAKGLQTRQAILDAAIARFGRDGYRATAVADIVRDAGVGGTVAYAYFPNKEALFLAAVDEDAAVVRAARRGPGAGARPAVSRGAGAPGLGPARHSDVTGRRSGGLVEDLGQAAEEPLLVIGHRRVERRPAAQRVDQAGRRSGQV